MKILDISWRNFNSYGNNTQTLKFNQAGGELNLLIGENGHGKSTIAEAITFALYGKVDGKKMSDLPNRINKELWVQINIICKGRKLTIIRGISPGIFDVFIDGEPYDQAGKSNVQEYLETEFYDIPFQVFKNIIVLSIEDFKSFLTMTPGDKRNIIDRLFGFSIINQMKDSVKLERRELKASIKTYDDELNIINQSIDSISAKLLSLNEEQKEDKKSLISQLKIDATKLVEDKKLVNENLEKLKTKEALIQEKYKEVNSSLGKLNTEISQKQRMIDLYDNDCCPTCERAWDTHDLKNKDETSKSLTKCKVKKDDLNKELTDSTSQIQKFRQFESKFRIQLAELNRKLQSVIADLKKYSVENDDTKFKHLNELLLENEKSKESKNILKGKDANEDSFLVILESILGDDGVKNLAVKSILPSLNANITKMAAQMHLPYSIYFDEKFDCIITHLGTRISAKTLSSGQRKKSDFIIIIALIRLMKLRYPELNLLFLDELLSSVDASGRHEILKILRETVRESNLISWVINHSELPIELFDRRGEVYFDSGFSQLDIELLN